jgi:transcriptional regulator with XRE-family HTH domain
MKKENLNLLDDKETALEHIGNKIYEERTKQKITLTSLANKTLLSEGYIRSIEKGRYACSVINFLKICMVLKIDFNEILNDSNNEENTNFLNINKTEEENEKVKRINKQILKNSIEKNKNIGICISNYMKEKI